MKQNYFFLAMTLLILPGCGGEKKIEPEKPTTPDNQVEYAQTNLEYNFDAEIEAFAQEMAQLDMDLMADSTTDVHEADTNSALALSDDENLWDEDFLFQAFEPIEFKTVLFGQDDAMKLSEEQEEIMNLNVAYAKKMIEEKKPDQTVRFYLTSDTSNTEELFSGDSSIAEKRVQLVVDKFMQAGISDDLIVATACDPDDGMTRKDEVRIEYTIS